MRPYIAVVGSGERHAVLDEMAYDVGRLLADSGAVCVCGGLGGVMAAVARGVRTAGGTTLGLLPGPDRAAANSWVDVAVPTGLGELRDGLVVRAGDAVIAIGGGWGTLAEIALARKADRVVVGLHTWVLPEVLVAADPPDAVGRALAACGEADRRSPP